MTAHLLTVSLHATHAFACCAALPWIKTKSTSREWSHGSRVAICLLGCCTEFLVECLVLWGYPISGQKELSEKSISCQIRNRQRQQHLCWGSGRSRKMQAQFNIRNNIQQMQDFQKSIADWSKEADQKDRQLRWMCKCLQSKGSCEQGRSQVHEAGTGERCSCPDPGSLSVVRCRSSSQAASSSQPVRSQALKDENMGGAVPPVRGQAKGEVSGGPSGSRVMPPVRGQATRQGPGGQAAARPLRAAPGKVCSFKLN